jgi:hypothetical protein
MLLSEIPGLQKAVQRAQLREDAMRVLPFLPHAAALAGIPLRPLTPRHFTLLCVCRSPFVFGRDADFDAALQFLWILSPDYVQPSPQFPLAAVRSARKAWQASIWPKVRKLRLQRVNRVLKEHLDDALFDAPKSDGSNEAPVAHLCALLVDEFASAYPGWVPQTFDTRGQPIPGGGILDLPFAELLQYRRARTARAGRHPGVSHVDRVKLAHVRKYNAAQKAKAAKRRTRAEAPRDAHGATGANQKPETGKEAPRGQ